MVANISVRSLPFKPWRLFPPSKMILILNSTQKEIFWKKKPQIGDIIEESRVKAFIDATSTERGNI